MASRRSAAGDAAARRYRDAAKADPDPGKTPPPPPAKKAPATKAPAAKADPPKSEPPAAKKAPAKKPARRRPARRRTQGPVARATSGARREVRAQATSAGSFLFGSLALIVLYLALNNAETIAPIFGGLGTALRWLRDPEPIPYKE